MQRDNFSLEVSRELAGLVMESYSKLTRVERVGIRSVQDYARRLLCERVSEKLEDQGREDD